MVESSFQFDYFGYFRNQLFLLFLLSVIIYYYRRYLWPVTRKRETAAEIVYSEIGEKKIISELSTNKKHLVITKDIVYIGTIGLLSGSWYGKKVKRYPIDAITSIDVREAAMTAELEITMAGSVESGKIFQGYFSRAKNENIVMFPKTQYKEVQDFAGLILEVQQIRKNRDKLNHNLFSEPKTSIPEQIKQLSELKDAGIITLIEFEDKKSDLLNRM